jgi:peptidoglycan/xylan/chitin deacetylase (PgdA/CDA1 family)
MRDLVNESLFEYGSRVGAWRILEILQKHTVSATFFVSGLAAERNPGIARAIVENGHEASGHGYRWTEYHEMSAEEQAADIGKCLTTIESITGHRPVGWLNRYAPSDVTRDLLADEGRLIYDNNAYNDDVPYYVAAGAQRKPWLVLPYSMELNDARAWRGPMLSSRDLESSFVDAFNQLLAESKRRPRMMSIGLHCRISGTPGRAGVLDRFLDYARHHDEVWFARRDDIAHWWLQQCPPIQKGPVSRAGRS